MYFPLLDSQIDINQAFALAWAHLTGSVFGAVLANAATLANTVAELAHHTEIPPSDTEVPPSDTEIRTSDASRRVDETADRTRQQYLVADEVFDEVVELLVVADIIDAAR